MFTRHLQLKALYNARDLGGYATADGGVTAFGVFLRADAPCDLPQTDIDALLSYGVTGSVDLRSDGERAARPSSLRSVGDYYERSLFSKAAIFGQAPPPQEQGWLEKYIGMAELSREWAVQVLDLCAAQPGCLLYHCTTGKDRTGLLSCYLLSIAGVPKADIAADYCVSELFLEPVYARMRNGTLPLGAPPGGNPPPPQQGEDFFATPASAMLGLISYMEGKYGGVVGYLRQAGLTEETFSAIRRKFVRYS